MPRAPQDVADATLRLVLASGIGPSTWRRLREHFVDDARIAKASVHELADIEGIGGKTADALRRNIDQTDPDTERNAMSRRDVSLILAGDEDYPALLATIPDPPKALWMRGRLQPDDRLALAMVGSRRCSSYGREQAGRFAALLAEAGLTIVSGGARGIDGEAHRGALRANGRTIAVLGCGLLHDYPPEHEGLFNEIVEKGGALLSEYPMHTKPRGEHFPRRNRIISGLTLGTLVIEAAGTRSGALITARKAAEEHGREVMAVPGRVDSPASAGCLHAIREGCELLPVKWARQGVS